MASVEERFWRHVSRGQIDECWEWTGSRDQRGYGKLAVARGQSPVRASRVALAIRLGRPIGDGMCACHSCDNPPCCNPAHLYEGNQSQNLQDAVRRGRHNPRSLLNLRPGEPGVRGAAKWPTA